MTEICHQERVHLRELIDLLPYLKRLVQLDKENSAAIKPAQPQPVATLGEDTEILLKHLDDYFSGVALESFKNNVRHALTAERKRQAELDPLLRHVVLWYKRKVNQETGADEILIHNIANYLRHTDALDAFDKGAENG